MFSKGMTLIEVLVASFILGTGILCLLALQTSAFGIGIVSGHRQQASLLLIELAELAHISPGAFREIDPSLLISASVAQSCLEGSMCAPVTFVRNELSAWCSIVKNRLPDAQIDIKREWRHGQVIWNVTLSWHGPRDFSQSRMQVELQL